MTNVAKLTDFKPDDKNANRGSIRGDTLLRDALRKHGAARSIVVDKDGWIIAGNKTAEAALAVGMDNAIVIETDGSQLVVVKRTDVDLHSAAGRELAISDNRASELSLDWDVSALSELLNDGVNLETLFDPDELDMLMGELEFRSAWPDEPPVLAKSSAKASADPTDDETTEDEPLDEPIPAMQSSASVSAELPSFNVRYPSDNEWDIPTLDIRMQATGFDLPIRVYGNQSRKLKFSGGTMCFYVDDYRFNAIWKDPTELPRTGVQCAIEPNFSIFGDSPRADALYQVFRKRYLARYWQTCGVRIVVDMNVGGHMDLNLIGVPQGWKAYATRGGGCEPEQLDDEYKAAQERAGTEDILFLVYGGGKKFKDYAALKRWTWTPELLAQ